MPGYMQDYRIIAVLGFFRTFSGAIIGTGMAIFILNYWSSYFWSGVSSAAIALPYIVATIICGRISDKIGRRASLIISTVANFCISLGYMVIVIAVQFTVETWLVSVIIALRLGEGVANGFFWPILQASLSDVSRNCRDAATRRQVGSTGSTGSTDSIDRKGQGIYNLGWSTGVLCGQVILSTLSIAGLLDVSLLIPIATQGVNLLVVLRMFHVTINRPDPGDAPPGSAAESGIHDVDRVAGAPGSTGAAGAGRSPGRHVLQPSHLVALIGLVMIIVYGYALGSLSTTTTNLLKAWGVAPLVGYMEAIRLAMQALTASKVRLERHGVSFKITGAGALLAGIFMFMAGLAIVFTPPAMDAGTTGMAVAIFMAVYAINGLVFGIIYAEAMNLVLTSGATDKRGLLMGLFESFIGTGFFLGPYIAGLITDSMTFHDSYFFSAMLMLVLLATSLVMAMTLRKKTRAPGCGRTRPTRLRTWGGSPSGKPAPC